MSFAHLYQVQTILENGSKEQIEDVRSGRRTAKPVYMEVTAPRRAAKAEAKSNDEWFDSLLEKENAKTTLEDYMKVTAPDKMTADELKEELKKVIEAFNTFVVSNTAAELDALDNFDELRDAVFAAEGKLDVSTGRNFNP